MDIRTEWNDKIFVLWLYGSIYQDTWDANYLREQMAKATREGMTELVVYINSPGGDVVSGSDLFETFKNMSVPTTAVVRGLAASMAAFLLFAFDDVKMSAKAKIMFHEVKTFVPDFTSAAQLRRLADLTESFTADYAKEVGKKTTVSTEDFLAKIAAGDWWLTAEQAVAIGLVSEIINDPAQADMAAPDVTATSKSDTIYKDFYAPLKAVTLFNNHSNDSIAMSKITQKLKLPDDATEDQILAAIEAREVEMAAALKKAETAEAEIAEAEIDAAIADGKIHAAMKTIMQAAYKADSKSAREQLAKMPKVQGAGKRISDTIDRAKSTAHTGEPPLTYDELAEQGADAVEDFAKKNPVAYRAMLDKHFGASTKKRVE